jgi:hypothetical protein
VIADVPLLQRADEPQLTILEPSAGEGALAFRCLRSRDKLKSWSGGIDKWAKDYRFDNLVDCVEFQAPLARKLERTKKFRKVYNLDFLLLKPETTGLYDRVVMNPPFDRERDIDHVMHALKFLKPDGLLTAIMSAGTEFRDTKKSVAFRALMKKMGATFSDLPAGSFSSVGTNCNTIVVRVWNDCDGTRRRSYGGRYFE